MNADLKRKWIGALRSGNYFQGTGHLCYNSVQGKQLHCCLGVLCEVTGLEKKVFDTGEIVFSFDSEFGIRNMMAYLNINYREHIGLPYELHEELIQMNDTGKPFTVIADYIEENL